MSLRHDIDRALAVIGFDASYGGLGQFRRAACHLSGDVRLGIRLGAAGREVVASDESTRAARIDRWGAVTTAAPISGATDPTVLASARALAATLGGDVAWLVETAAPALETTRATVTISREGARSRLATLLSLRVAGAALRASAHRAALDLADACGGLAVSVALAGGELLPELFIRARWSAGGPSLRDQPWFPPTIAPLLTALEGGAPLWVELALSAELGLGLSVELAHDAIAEPLPAWPAAVMRARAPLSILSAAADSLEGSALANFQQAILSNDIGPLPGLVPSARRAHARALARRFVREKRLPRAPMTPSRVHEVAERSRIVGLARAVVAGAAG